MSFLELSGTPALVADKALRTLVAFGIFWPVYSVIKPFSGALGKVKDILSPEIVSWLVTVIQVGVVLTGAATILQIWGIEIAPIIAGFGLCGVAVALGAQDLFKNLLGGVSILVEKRFAIGDVIQVEGVVRGTVEYIGFRSTRIRRFDQVLATVPNNVFSDHAVINYSTMRQRRIYWLVGLEYGTSVEQMKAISDNIIAWIKGHKGFVQDDNIPLEVVVDGFNDSSIDMIVYCFTKATQWNEWLAVKQELAFAIKDIVEQAGAGFAFPSRSLYVETLPQRAGEKAEAFVPPDDKEK